MPAAVNIVLADAQATPVNHTFVPIGLDATTRTYWFEDQSQASPAGYWRISIQMQRPQLAKSGESSQNRNYRVTVGLHEPVMENVTNGTVSGIAPAPTVSYIPRVFSEYILPERASLQNRKDLRKMCALLQNNALVVDVIENLTSITG